MKLRIRSTEMKETVRIEVPNPCSLHDLKILIAGKLSGDISPESIRLSLNNDDELVPSSPLDSLQSIGIASGDHLYYSLRVVAPISETLNPDGGVPCVVDPNPNPHEEALSVLEAAITKDKGAAEEDADFSREGTSGNYDMDYMDTELLLAPPPPPPPPSESFSVPCFLKRVIESDKEHPSKGKLGLIAIAVHEVFLESGYVPFGGQVCKFPDIWESVATNTSFRYTIPGLGFGSAKDVTLIFSVMGNAVVIYGHLSAEHPDVYRLCLYESLLLPSLSAFRNQMSEAEEKVFEFWKTVKDRLCLPLLIDLCDYNGLSLPPCFALLPTELKLRVLEFLPGQDVARAACVSKELRFLASRSNDVLWKHKFLDEFGMAPAPAQEMMAIRWKDRFVEATLRKRVDIENAQLRRNFGVRRGTLIQLPRHPFIGGVNDLFPANGGPLNRRAGLRRVALHCHLGRI